MTFCPTNNKKFFLQPFFWLDQGILGAVMWGCAYSRRRRARDIRRAAGGAQAAVTTPHAEVVSGSG